MWHMRSSLKKNIVPSVFNNYTSRTYASYFSATIEEPHRIPKKPKNKNITGKITKQSNIPPLQTLKEKAGTHPVIFRRSCSNYKCLEYNCTMKNMKKPPCNMKPEEHNPSFDIKKDTKVIATGHTTHGYPKNVALYPLSFLYDLDNTPGLINYVQYKEKITAKNFQLKIDHGRTKVLQQKNFTDRLNMYEYENEVFTSRYHRKFLNLDKKSKVMLRSRYVKTKPKSLKYKSENLQVKNRMKKKVYSNHIKLKNKNEKSWSEVINKSIPNNDDIVS